MFPFNFKKIINSINLTPPVTLIFFFFNLLKQTLTLLNLHPPKFFLAQPLFVLSNGDLICSSITNRPLMFYLMKINMKFINLFGNCYFLLKLTCLRPQTPQDIFFSKKIKLIPPATNKREILYISYISYRIENQTNSIYIKIET